MEKFKKVKTWKDVQNDPRIEDFDIEYERNTMQAIMGKGGVKSYWVYVKEGFHWEDMNTIHEWTIADICRQVNRIELQTN